MLEQALREAARVQDGRVPLLERHLARLRAGGCDDATIDEARAQATRAAAAWSGAYGRMSLLVSLDGAIEIHVEDRPSTIQVAGGPIGAIVETDTPALPPGAAKPADRSFWDQALHKAQAAGAHLAIMIDHDGFLIDGSQCTVWLVVDGELATPPSPPALAGVSRAVVFDIAKRENITARECMLSAVDYERAEEVIFTTAVAGAIAECGRAGRLSAAISEAFRHEFGLE